jgi:hypothetical protein
MVAQVSVPACSSGFPDVLPGRAAARHLDPRLARPSSKIRLIVRGCGVKAMVPIGCLGQARPISTNGDAVVRLVRSSTP